MVAHELKSWPEHFDPLFRGAKTSELRRNDRGFKVGDSITFREWSPQGWLSEGGYSGRKCTRLVTHILTAEDVHGVWDKERAIGGLQDGYVVLSLWRVTVNGKEME